MGPSHPPPQTASISHQPFRHSSPDRQADTQTHRQTDRWLEGMFDNNRALRRLRALTIAKRAFRCTAPSIWNSLPNTVLDSDSFKSTGWAKKVIPLVQCNIILLVQMRTFCNSPCSNYANQKTCSMRPPCF